LAAKYFEEQSLTVERAVLQGDSGVNAGLSSGDIQFGAETTTSHLAIVNRGAPRLAVYGLMNKMSLDLVVNNAFLEKKGVSPSDPLEKRLKAMAGGRFATISLGGGSEKIARYLAQLGGADPQQGVEIVQIGSVPQIIAAIKQGTIDGVTLSQPTGFTAEAEGWGKILVTGSEVPELQGYHFTVVVVNPDWAKQNADVVRRFNAALTKGSQTIATDPSRATDLLVSFYQAVPQPVMRKSTESLADGVNRGGQMSVEAWDRVIKVETAFSPELKLDARSGQGVWWTNEYLP
jgi:ABC-type nitrate/sulfonate/bicarbonate transport system substrate-binding protein